jgi:ribosomal protein RSM22 (predicted rRNA methylase)
MNGLPAWIGAALDHQLEHVSRAALRERAQAASGAYRGGGSSGFIRTDSDALAYALVRMPATYAAVRACLRQTIGALPTFAPVSFLDVGAGPGTATWAAVEAWPSARRSHWIDRNPFLLALGRTLHAAPGAPQVDLSISAGDSAGMLERAGNADVVLASYALAEVAPAATAAMLSRLWQLADRLLVLVEPGTTDGFKRLLACRNLLLAHGAQIIAPCSHHDACPLVGQPRWCHFGVRLPRSRDHLLLKSASVPYEDEKFIYLVAGKGFGIIARGRRVLATPRVSKAGVSLDFCAPGTVETRVVTRRQKDAYKAAKRCDWGDALP